jgi:hypothetical protein
MREGLDISKVTYVATDGTPAMTGQYKGSDSLLKKDNDHNVISFIVLPIKRPSVSKTFQRRYLR